MGRLGLVFILAAASLSAAPAGARATLVFDRNPVHSAVWVANDDGSGARRLVAGSLPHISPDGAEVAYETVRTGSYRPDLMVVSSDGAATPRTLAPGWRDPYSFAWSPDSHTIAAVAGPELGVKTLVLIDVASGARRAVARGFFSGVSFSPAGDALVYARAPSEAWPLRADVYRIPLAGGTPARITADHRSLTPLWGPREQIVFVKLVDTKRRRYGPKNELYLMRPDGRGVRRLTHTRVDPLLQGLSPTQWSADGSRLLAELGGQDTSYAETVDPRTGAHRPLTKALEQGLVGARLSADGSTILAATGGFEPSSHHDVVTIPYRGGRLRILARNALDPDWNR